MLSRPYRRKKPGRSVKAEQSLPAPACAAIGNADRQYRRVEVFARWLAGPRMIGKIGRGNLQMRNALPVMRSQPAILTPDHLLDRRFAAQYAAAAIGQRAAAEMDHIGFSILRFDEIGVAGALQFDIRPAART